jgi:hypothetical protein
MGEVEALSRVKKQELLPAKHVVAHICLQARGQHLTCMLLDLHFLRMAGTSED